MKNKRNQILECQSNTWNPIKGFEGLYNVNQDGVVMSIPRNGTSKSVKYRSGTEMLSRGGKKYRAIILAKNGSQKRFLIHRLVAESFIPNPENKPQVNHKDNNGLNNVLDNLEWVTPKENIQHAISSGSFDNYYKNHHWRK